MPRGSGYRLPLLLTREMQLAFNRLLVALESPDDFPVALRVFRAGLVAYDVLKFDGLKSMYKRKLLGDEEAAFLVAKFGLEQDFRPVRIELIHQAQERKSLNQQFGAVLEDWDGLKPSAKIHWIKEARKYVDLPNAEKVCRLKVNV